MNVADIKRRLKEIEDLSDDDEAAHVKEDLLWSDVLQAIADGAESPSKLATAALKTNDIDFSRWYA